MSPALPPSPAIWTGWTTAPDRQVALQIARGLVEARLAACVQIEGPLTAVYRWEGRLEEATEFRLSVKFPETTREALQEWLRQHHPYQVPQWVAVPAGDVLPAYGAWVRGVSAD